MCLVTTQKTALIAEKNITVYKVMYKDLKPIFKFFKYELNHLHETEIKESEEWATLGILEKWLGNYPNNSWKRHPDLICLGQGFHSIKKIRNARLLKSKLFNNTVIFKCIIPKGSEYYMDAEGLMISNKIIIKKEI